MLFYGHQLVRHSFNSSFSRYFLTRSSEAQILIQWHSGVMNFLAGKEILGQYDLIWFNQSIHSINC